MATHKNSDFVCLRVRGKTGNDACQICSKVHTCNIHRNERKYPCVIVRVTTATSKLLKIRFVRNGTLELAIGFAGSGARKPRRELEGSALDFFCSLF